MRNRIKYLPIVILTLITVFSAVELSGASADAATTGTKNVGVTVETTCSFTNASSSYTTAISVTPGMSADTTGLTDVQKPPFTVSCNNLNGFKVKAIGFSPDSTHPSGLEGNTGLYSTAGTISTGTSGSSSYWAFRISSATASGTTVTTSYGAADTWYAVPSSLVSVADFAGTGTGATVTGSVRADYKVFVNNAQPSATYTGAVKYSILGNS